MPIHPDTIAVYLWMCGPKHVEDANATLPSTLVIQSGKWIARKHKHQTLPAGWHCVTRWRQLEIAIPSALRVT